MKYDDRFDENVDLIGLGLANAAAGISGHVRGQRLPDQDRDGRQRRWPDSVARLTTAAIVVVVLLFLTVPLAYMPNAVLAAVVFLIGLRLIDYQGMRASTACGRPSSWSPRSPRPSWSSVGVEQGIILAIVPVDPRARLQATDRTTACSAGRARASWSRARRQRHQPRPAWSSTASGRAVLRERRRGSPRRSWSLVEAADPPLRWFCPRRGGRWAMSTTRVPETLGAVHEELERQNATLVLVHVDAGGAAPPGRLRADRPDRCLRTLPDRHGLDGWPTAPSGRRAAEHGGSGRLMPEDASAASVTRSTEPQRAAGAEAAAPRPARGLRGLAAGAGTSRSRRTAPRRTGDRPHPRARARPLRPDGRVARSRSSAAQRCRWRRTSPDRPPRASRSSCAATPTSSTSACSPRPSATCSSTSTTSTRPCPGPGNGT